MLRNNKKFLIFYLIAQFFIVIFNIAVLYGNFVLFIFFISMISAYYTNRTIESSDILSFCLWGVVFTLIFLSSILTIFIYPFVARSTYKLLKDKQLTRFQTICFMSFPLLIIPTVLECIILQLILS